MIRTQVQLEEDQIAWLRAEARARGMSISQLVREGVALFRAREERFPEDEKRRALSAVGRFSSDANDVSERHDAYLAEAFTSRLCQLHDNAASQDWQGLCFRQAFC